MYHHRSDARRLTALEDVCNRKYGKSLAFRSWGGDSRGFTNLSACADSCGSADFATVRPCIGTFGFWEHSPHQSYCP